MARILSDIQLVGAMRRVAIGFDPDPSTGCWVWRGSLNSGGYGQLSIRGGAKPSAGEWRKSRAASAAAYASAYASAVASCKLHWSKIADRFVELMASA